MSFTYWRDPLKTDGLMYRLLGSDSSVLEVTLLSGGKVEVSSGHLLDVPLQLVKVGTTVGLFEPAFRNVHVQNVSESPQNVLITVPTPGHPIVALAVSAGHSWKCKKESFVAMIGQITTGTTSAVGYRTFSGTGTLFVYTFGEPLFTTLGDGETHRVDDGCFVAVATPGDIDEFHVVRGDGMCATCLYGPGEFLIQSVPEPASDVDARADVKKRKMY